MFPPYSARFITEKIIQFPEIGESHEKFLSSYSFFQSINQLLKQTEKENFEALFIVFRKVVYSGNFINCIFDCLVTVKRDITIESFLFDEDFP